MRDGDEIVALSRVVGGFIDTRAGGRDSSSAEFSVETLDQTRSLRRVVGA
jgi:hypothetical protein